MSDITNINSSMIAPHIRELLDDIISMTDDIVLKNSKLANSSDNDTSYKLSLYYSQIQNNSDSLTMYDNFPEEILSSLSEWRIYDGDIRDKFHNLTLADKQPMLNNTNICYMGNIEPSNDIGEQGDGYFIPYSYDYNHVFFVWGDIGGRTLVTSLKDVINDDPEKLEYLYVTTDYDNPDVYQHITDVNLYIKDGKEYKLYDILNSKDKIMENEPDNFYIMDLNAIYYYKYQSISDNDIAKINNKKMFIPDKYKDTILRLMREWVINNYAAPSMSSSNDFMVNRYFGETNQYYRTLNGLPPVDNMYNQPKIDRYLINPNYSGDNPNPYLWELTDDEVHTITDNGLIDKYLDTSLRDMEYLKFMGDKRIDAYKARQAYDFDILRIGKYEHAVHYQMFIENFRISRDYILYKFYHPELFADHDYYINFISYLIIAQTMCMCITKSDSILINDLYSDSETIRNRLQSYGLDVFDDIPLMYRKQIAKYIESLIRNKGSDLLYDNILKIFNLDNIDIYKYFYRRKKGISDDGDISIDLSMSKIPLHNNNFISDMVDKSNEVDYDKITGEDPYWGSYGMPIGSGDPDEYLKNILKNSQFNYMNSKYISVDSIYNLSKLNYNSAYLLLYLSELSKRNISIDMKLDGYSGRIPLFQLIVALFAIQAAQLKYDGNIQYDPIPISSVLKYNLEGYIEYNNQYMTILDFYKKYYLEEYYRYTNANGTKIKDGIESADDEYTRDSVANELLNISLPDTLSLDDICNEYIKNSSNNGIYIRLMSLKENTKDFNEYKCYSELFKAITISKINTQLFKLKTSKFIEVDNPYIWIKYGEYSIDEESNEAVTDKLYLKLNIDSIVNDYYDENILISKLYNFAKDKTKPFILSVHQNNQNIDINLYDKNNTDDVISYICVKPSTVTPYEAPIYQSIDSKNIPIYYFYCDKETNSIYRYIQLINDNWTIDFMKENNQINLNRLQIYIGTEDINSADKSKWIVPMYYIQYFEDGSFKVYTYTSVAPTFLDYLKEWCPQLYNTINANNTDYSNENGIRHLNNDYYERISELFLNIVNTIEKYVSSDEMKSVISNSIMDLSLLTEYIIKVINVFKSINIDICTAEMVYEINDYRNNRVRIFDTIATDITEYHYDDIKYNDTLSIDEESVFSSGVEIRDELIIE